jgi:hypothetical protein
MITWLVLFLGLSSQAFAKAGVADGGAEFILTIAGFLLILAGIDAGIEYLIRNGRDLLNQFKSFLKKRILVAKKSD